MEMEEFKDTIFDELLVALDEVDEANKDFEKLCNSKFNGYTDEFLSDVIDNYVNDTYGSAVFSKILNGGFNSTDELRDRINNNRDTLVDVAMDMAKRPYMY